MRSLRLDAAYKPPNSEFKGDVIVPEKVPTVTKKRWLEYMLDNGYLDRSTQKAFMKATPG